MRARLVSGFVGAALALPPAGWSAAHSAAGIGTGAGQAAPEDKEGFLITGSVVRHDASAVVAKKVWALPVDAKGDIVRSFDVTQTGILLLASPSAVTDSKGSFSLRIDRTYALPGQKGLKLVAVVIDPSMVDIGRHMVLVNVPDDLKSSEPAKLVWSRSGTALPDAATMSAGVRFKLNNRWVTTEKVANTVGLKLEAPIRVPSRAGSLDVASLVADADGFLCWNRLASPTKSGKTLQWEAVMENGWVESYRLLDADIAAIQGQDISVPTAAGKSLAGRIEGQKISISR